MAKTTPTNITLPDSIFERVDSLQLANRSFYLRSTLVAFESSDHCHSGWISRMPDLGKCLIERNGEMVKSTVTLKFTKAELKMHREIAKKAAGGSMSMLITAALHWAETVAKGGK